MRIVEKLIKNKGLINTCKFEKLQLLHNFNIIFHKKLLFFLLKNKNKQINKKKVQTFSKNVFFFKHFYLAFCTLVYPCFRITFKKCNFRKLNNFINLYFYKKIKTTYKCT